MGVFAPVCGPVIAPAYAADGSGMPWDQAGGAPLAPPATAPVISTSSFTIDGTITWSAVPGATGYTLYRDGVSAGSVTSPYTIVAADVAATSVYLVPFNGAGNGPASNALSVWIVYRDGRDALYSGGLLTSWPARVAPVGVTPTLVPTGGDSTKPISPLLTMGVLTGPFFRTSLVDTTPTWGKGGYIEFAGTVSAAALAGMTRVVCGYANLDVPTGYTERQEMHGCNVAGGSSEPTNLLGYPGTGITTIGEYNGTAWKAGAFTPRSWFFVIVSVFKADDSVDVYVNGRAVDPIADGWVHGTQQLINLFSGAAWHAGTTTMSAPFDGHRFVEGYADHALSAADVAAVIGNLFTLAGRSVAADWWPSDDANTKEFLDLGGRTLLEYSGDASQQRVRAWQGRDQSSRVHNTTNEASSAARGFTAGNLINMRETAIFDGVDDFYTSGTLAHFLDGSKECLGGFILNATAITNTDANGYTGHSIVAEDGGVWAVNLWNSGGQRKARFYVWDGADKQVNVNITVGLDTWIEYWQTGGQIFVRAVDSNGKRTAAGVAAGGVTATTGNAFVGKGYAGSSFLAAKLHRWAHRAGFDATYQTQLRAWATRELGIDCT